jgi:hypothetical protein
VTSSSPSPAPAGTPNLRPWRSGWSSRIVAFTPLVVFVLVSLFARTYFGRSVEEPPSIIGIPLGIVVQGLAFFWMLIGVVAVWDARSRAVELVSLLVFTIPATIVTILGPAIILIMQNLG